MQNVFLDANYFIDLFDQKRSEHIDCKRLSEHLLFISPVSVHILIYVYGYTIPSLTLSELDQQFNFVAMDRDVVINFLQGPSSDFEDNVQLHSATSIPCDFFLTRDKKLLNTRFFGSMKIIDLL